MIEVTQAKDGVMLRLKVVPGASRDRIVGELGGALKIAVSAPPEKGRANKAVIGLLAKALGLRANQIEVVSGTTSPGKSILIRGATPEAVRRLAGQA